MTHPNLLDCADSVLVVVDMQSRLTAVMPENDAALMTENAIGLLQAAKILNVPVLLTEQYPKGLGPTAPEILDQLADTARVFDKTGFSCCAASGFTQALESIGRRQVILIGQEAHVCVLQTALELIHLGYSTYIVEDAVCSRQSGHKVYALKRMQQLGGTIVCHESVLFEWLRDSKHADFKAVSSLLR